MMQEYEIDHFKINDYIEKPIIENGYLTSGIYKDFYYLNYSSILTRLIFTAGRFCEHYASDLFIWWESVKKKLDNGTMGTESFLFGFYTSGVDSTPSVIKGCNSYRAIYRLDFEVNGNKIKATLGRCL